MARMATREAERARRSPAAATGAVLQGRRRPAATDPPWLWYTRVTT